MTAVIEREPKKLQFKLKVYKTFSMVTNKFSTQGISFGEERGGSAAQTTTSSLKSCLL